METNHSGSLPKREEIPDRYKWDLAAIYPSDEAWETDFEKLKALVGEIGRYQPDFPKSAQHLHEVLGFQDHLGRLLDKLFVYARMHKDENNANPVYQAMTNRIQSLATEAGGALSFVVPALVALPDGKLDEFINQLPQLGLYKHFLAEISRQRAHILSAESEKLLAESAEVADVSGDVFGMLDNADLKFPNVTDEAGNAVQLTKGRYSRFLESPDRRVRRDAFKALLSTYHHYRNTLAATLNGSVKADVFYARARQFESALEASLDGDNIPVAVYDRLIGVVREFIPALNRYLKLRRKMLNLEELHLYDLYAPLIPEYQRQVPYEEARELVLEGLKPLGEEYLKRVREGFDGGWVDVCETDGKTGGAYAWGAYDTHPYILLNYQGKIHDVFTIAHEMGHALHSYYSHQTQPYVYASYKIFVAEVASTVNEALLMEAMLSKSTDPKERLYLINQRLEQFRTTVFRQTMFAEFEKIIHQQVESGGALTADWFSESYLKLNKDYYGAETVIDDEIAMEWSRIPHFYTPFYVYKYATGYSAATALSQMLLTEGATARDRYLRFLKGGGSDYPLNLLRGAGVDMESPEPVRSALQVFENLVAEMIELTGTRI